VAAEHHLIDARRRAERYDASVAAALPATAGLMALMYGMFALLHPFFLTGTPRIVMTVMAGMSAIMLAILYGWTSRHPVPGHRAHLLTYGAGVLVAGNTLLHLVIMRDPLQTANVILLLAASGASFLAVRWLVAAHTFVWVGWLGALPLLPRGTLRDWIFAMVLATVFGIAIHSIRRGAIDRLGLAIEEAERAAVEDNLTGMLNRRGLSLVGEQVLAGARRSGNAVHATFVDVDNLKVVNDRLGHAAGDRVLLAVAESLKASVRAGDVVSRWGGDEFCILGAGQGTAPADLERRVAARLAEFPPDDVPDWVPEVSAGAAMLAPWDDGDLAELLDRADREMYRRRLLRRSGRQVSEEPEPASE